MTDILLSAVSEAEKNIFPTLSLLSENDVDNIWSNVSSFVERQMSLQKGVHIAGLGTFTFSLQRLDVGNKHILIQRPIFLLSEKLVHSHCLKQVKALPAGEVPVVPLNFTVLSVDSPFDRDQVEGCVRETLLLLLRAVASGRSVLFTFHSIGLLSFRHGRVKMKFYRDFLMAMDRTGRLLWALSNRPGISDSLVSSRGSSQQRPESDQAILLPSKPAGEQRRGPEEQQRPLAPLEPDSKEEDGKPENQTIQRPSTRQTLQPAKVNGICLTEDLDIPPQIVPVDRSAMPIGQCEGAPKELDEQERREDGDPDHTCEDHSCAGQELCCLCLQRAQRNVPVYLGQGRLREEQEEERLLMLNEQHRDQLLLQREQAEQHLIQENNQKVAAFNLGVAEALKHRASQRPTKFYGSYIFRSRPLTPSRLPKQRLYLQELVDQAEVRRCQNTRTRQTQELIDRLDQVQLAEETTQLKLQQLQQKTEKVKCYKKALDTQMEDPNVELPARLPDSARPLFGLWDCLPQDLAEQRRRARETYRHQLNSALQRRRGVQFKRIIEQRREIDMLNRTQRDVIADRIIRHNKLHSARTTTEDTWRRSTEAKRQRDLEEKSFTKAGSRLLQDQCDEHHRCQQCQRRIGFSGGTNIWKESCYVTGSRLMV